MQPCKATPAHLWVDHPEPEPSGKHLAGEWRASLQCKRERFEWWVCLQNPGERMSLITFQTENISHHSESELFYPLIGSCRIKKIAVWESARRWVGERGEAYHSHFLEVRQLPRKDESTSFLWKKRMKSLINIMGPIHSSYWTETVLRLKMTIGPSIICQLFSCGQRINLEGQWEQKHNNDKVELLLYHEMYMYSIKK